jgi:hypothetical protein
MAGRLKGKLLTNQTTVLVDITITITLVRAAELMHQVTQITAK